MYFTVVSIKRTVQKIFKVTLLNVVYNLKIQGLNTLTYTTYNRDLRVLFKVCRATYSIIGVIPAMEVGHVETLP